MAGGHRDRAIRWLRALTRPDRATDWLPRRTLARIETNLFWAFFSNAVGIPVAALGLRNPMIAGAAMAASSVLVATNHVRSRRFGPPLRDESASNRGRSAEGPVMHSPQGSASPALQWLTYRRGRT